MPGQSPGAGPTEAVIATGFTTTERERFRNLLELAARTPFPGERANAIAAAERLAGRHGMTVEEAACDQGPPREPVRDARPQDPFWSAFARSVHVLDAFIRADKARREEALRAARARGLDADAPEQRPPRRDPFTRLGGARRNPFAHARVLLRETELSLGEIVEITGLDVYTIAAMKLKMRHAA